jgi:hypothetical protein
VYLGQIQIVIKVSLSMSSWANSLHFVPFPQTAQASNLQMLVIGHQRYDGKRKNGLAKMYHHPCKQPHVISRLYIFKLEL